MLRLPPQAYAIPAWLRAVATIGGFGYAVVASYREFFPPINPNQIAYSEDAVSTIYDIINRLKLPRNMSQTIAVVIGDDIRITGGNWSVPGPVLQITPELHNSLGLPDIPRVNPRSPQAVGLRAKMPPKIRGVEPVPILAEFPFSNEREAVIGHELAQLCVNSSSRKLQLNTLFAITSLTFYRRPGFSFFGFGLLWLILSKINNRHCILSGDQYVHNKLGPNATIGMINRIEAQQSLEGAIWGQFRWDSYHIRDLIFDNVVDYIFYVDKRTRLEHLKALLRDRSSKPQKKSDEPSKMIPTSSKRV